MHESSEKLRQKDKQKLNEVDSLFIIPYVLKQIL